MNSLFIPAVLIPVIICIGSGFYLLQRLKKDKQLVSLIGLFCMAMGFILLVLDLFLIAFTQGMRHIPDYLLFNRLVSDTGFAGRWVLTVYLFLSAGPVVSIYLLAMNIIKKFNKKESGRKSQS